MNISITLAGVPNVGKSTVFNALTGMRQHTGNWPGKTVESARGRFKYKNRTFDITDTPGTYSLFANSPEEEVTRDHISSSSADVTVIVADATSLERSLTLALQILSLTDKAVLCVNLTDEAAKKGVSIDFRKLSRALGIPAVATAARSNRGLGELKDVILRVSAGEISTAPPKCGSDAKELSDTAEDIFNRCVTLSNPHFRRLDLKIDRLITSRAIGYPLMLLGLCGIFWITVSGANPLSDMLADLLNRLGSALSGYLSFLPGKLHSALIDGVYKTLAWVVSVMLPPMAIFFPLFTLLEDAGVLPRIAFMLDTCFKRSGAHGKQALTMCMGFGCNACGICGCRIIDSPRERLMGILTNNFVPCNGRFPILIALTGIFFTQSRMLSSLMLTLVISAGVLMTLAVNKVLSRTLLRGTPSSFALELPPYRRPQIGRVIIRSVFDRTLFVLGRAAAVAAPAGLVIWLLANISAGGATLISHAAELIQPLARPLGLDGVILLAFLLALPANELVIPLMLMMYTSGSTLTQVGSLSSLAQILTSNGWTWTTALCVIAFTLFHFPCATTLWTAYRETRSIKWTLVSFILPTLAGVLTCIAINLIF